MAPPTRIAAIGDVHRLFDARDAEQLHALGYDLILFVGDLAGYRGREALAVARHIARLETPALVIPGNHDGTHLLHLAAEVFDWRPLRDRLGGRQHRRVARLERALGRATLAGYSLHPLDAHELTVVAARPHSMGGPRLAFSKHLARAHGVRSMNDSAAKLRRLVDEAPHRRLIFLAHNGPTGLGNRRDDIWGCDFRPAEGDFGDPDLRSAVDHAEQIGKRVLAVVAGHMHHHLRGGGKRRTELRRDGTLYVNAARVPRIERRGGTERRHHLSIVVDGDLATAEAVSLEG